MAISRYNKRNVINNDDSSYVLSNIFKKRGVNMINHFAATELSYPSPEDIQDIIEITAIWGIGSSYYKLAHEFYNDPQYWWVIAWYNLRPLETDFAAGDTVIIPTPLETVLSGFGIV